MKWFGGGLNENDAADPFDCSIEFEATRFSLYVVAGFEYDHSYDKQYKFYVAGHGAHIFKELVMSANL